MRDCWSYQPNDRPPFSYLVSRLDKILTETTQDVSITNYFISSLVKYKIKCSKKRLICNFKEYLDLNYFPEIETPPSSQESSDAEDQDPMDYLLYR